MKATIKPDGTLVIISENDIEAYALYQWMDGSDKNAITIETNFQGTKMTIVGNGRPDKSGLDYSDIRLK